MSSVTYQNILFDIDATLLNTDKLDVQVYDEFAKILGVSVERVLDVDRQYNDKLQFSRDFNFEDYCKHFSSKFNFPIEPLLQVFYSKKIYSVCVLPDTVSTLDVLGKSYRLGIYSEGHEKFQLLKLQMTGLIDYFDNDLMFIFDNKRTAQALSMLPPNSAIVDNYLQVLEIAEELMPDNFGLIFKNNNNISYSSDKIVSIRNLGDLLDILQLKV